MSSLFNDWFGNTTDTSADATIAINSMSSTAMAATAYLNAALTSTTPEVRRLFSEYATQSTMANESITELAVSRKWINPYDTPEGQLQNSVQQAQSVIGNNQSL